MKSTGELLNNLNSATNLDEYFKKNNEDFLDITVSEYLNELLIRKNLTVNEIVKKSEVGDYVYKIFNGKRNPSRDVLIAISLSMKLTFEQTQLLLRIANMALLYTKSKRDSIIIFSLNYQKSVYDTNVMLNKYNLDEII